MGRSLLFSSGNKSFEPGVMNRVTAADAAQSAPDWNMLSMEVRHLQKGQQWQHNTGEHEVAIVLLGGKCSVKSDKGEWAEIGNRKDVFSGMPWALYLPRHTEFTVTALTEVLEFAHAWVPSDQDHSAQLLTPADSEIEIRGGHHATRQINTIIPPGFECHRIVACEVYTPHGNWSSYPPHKHDTHKTDAQGTVVEADLEEFYFYKIRNTKNQKNGYAVQRVYNDERTLDETVTAHDNDIVLVPEGYHPVSAAYGYDCYYLNFLAGSAQSLACTDDPDYAWTRETWEGNQDPRIPMVSHTMEKEAALV